MNASSLIKSTLISILRLIYSLLVLIKKDLLLENNKRIIYLSTPAHKKVAHRLSQYFGLLLTSFSVSAIIYSYSPLVQGYSLNTTPPKEVQIMPDIPQQQKPNNFEIIIPKLGINSVIIPNINPTDKDEYLPAMLNGVLHANSSNLPNEPGVTYLFAHSTNSPLYIQKFNAVFYRLRELEVGDRITILYNGETYNYQAEEKQIVETDNTYWINNPTSEKKLVLQTSHPPGTIWKRLLIIAKPLN